MKNYLCFRQLLFENLNLTVLLFAASLCAASSHAQDILLSDFEQSTYQWLPGGTWTATGTCFGTGPTKSPTGVSGYLGSGLVCTKLTSDDNVGTLTSPSFTITRKYIRFLIGAGNWRPQTTINLLVGGVVVRTAVGMGDREQLDWLQWNVSGFLNMTAQIQIVDNAGPHARSWRHLNLDQIIATDVSLSSVIIPGKKYLLLPVKTGAINRLVELVKDGMVVRDVNVQLSATPDFWVFMDLTPFMGNELVVRLDSKLATTTDLTNFFIQGDAIPAATETNRPIYHFSAKRGFLADPCGLVYKNGEYHMGYQHNQFGTAWDNMTHGHAVSTDLVHWTELPETITETYWGEAWNGTSVVDWNNTAGFGSGAMVSLYTSGAGYDNNPRMSKPNYFAQSLAYSTDAGRTFKDHVNNPVLPNVVGANRDPKVFWYAPGNVWVMVLYIDGTTYNIYNSTNLKNWVLTSTLGFLDTEDVVDLFPLPVDGDPNNVKWVFSAGYRKYMVGTFDGKKFTSQYGPFWLGRQKWDLSAAMTFSDIPATDGRRIMLTSGRTEYPGMPFNRYMNLPSVMTLKTIAGVPKLHTNPVAEVSLLRTSTMTWGSQTLNTGVNLMSGLSGEGVEFEIVFKPQSRSLVTFKLDKYWVVYNAGQNKIGAGEDGGNGQHRSLTPVNGQVHIRAFYDRGSWELYANGGEFYMPIPITPKAGNFPLSLTTANASIEIISMSLHHLGSANGRIGNFPEEVTNEESNFYSFYPNPVSAGYFMIDRNAFEEKELTIMLFDTAGKEVFKKMLPDGENRVDLSGDLPNGIYHVAIKGNKTIRNGRLLISK